MIDIINIEPSGIAAELNLKPGDKLLRINGHEIRDQLDYRFYTAEEYVELEIEKGGERVIFEIEKEFHEDLGIGLQEMELMSCGNNCPFCFVYQNPKGMRRGIYFKDEDYRFSFLYGHYVTLTTVGEADLKRIVEQHLSPLYISVHSTEAETRKLLLGIKHDDRLMEKIEYLTSNGIELHTQVVLSPDINDGEIFEKTVNDLKRFYPGVRSVAVVPLGLTRHRKNLMTMRLHTVDELNRMIEYTNKLRLVLRKELDDAFVYLSDEFFIKADAELPPADYYDDFYQIENGVGEFRDMVDRFESAFPQMNKTLKKPVRVNWVTGTLAAPWLNKFILTRLKTIQNLEIKLIPVVNEFFGETITISGLLTGQDIAAALQKQPKADLVLLPPRVLNKDGLFLDDETVPGLQEKVEMNCHVVREDISNIVDVIAEKVQ